MIEASKFKDAIFVSSTAPSFACVLEHLDGCPQLSPTRKRDLCSAVKRVATAICPGRSLAEIPADPEWCRPRISHVAPAAIGVSHKTWANLTSNLARAFKAAGIVKPRYEVKLEGEWAFLWSKLKATGDMQLSTGLSRFPRFCQQMGLQPGEVTDNTLEEFRDALRQNEIRRCPEDAMYRAARSWNLAVDRIEGWPPVHLTVPVRRRAYALQWSHFPASLEADVDAWLCAGSDDDIFSLDAPQRPLSPSTVKLRKGSIQRYASALVHSGVPIGDLVSIRALVSPELARRGLQWLNKNNHGNPGGGLGNIAISIKMAAKHQGDLSAEEVTQIEQLASHLSRGDRGMTEKNRNRLEVFKDPGVISKLVKLPEILKQKADTIANPVSRARIIETALAISILTQCPIRFGNLRALQIEKHLVWIGTGRHRRLVMRLPKSMVKNDIDIKFELPICTVTLLDDFLAQHRSQLIRAPSRFVFSKRSADQPIAETSLRTRIQNAIRDHLGVELTPHNFRHLAGLAYLISHPGQYEAVRRLLGHKHGSTALDHYVGLETDAAHRAYSQLLSDLSGQEDV